MNMMSPQYNLFDSQKSGDYTDNNTPLFNARQLDGASQQLVHNSLPRVIMDLHSSMAESDEEDNNGGTSLIYRNDDEHEDDASDMHLSFVYRPPSEDEQGMVLSANPAWMQLLDADKNLTEFYNEPSVRRNSTRGNDAEPESEHHRRRSFLSVNSSQKSVGGDEAGRSRRRSFMTVSSAGGSDVVAVKAGGSSFLRIYRLLYTSFHTLSHTHLFWCYLRWCVFPSASCVYRFRCLCCRCCCRIPLTTNAQQPIQEQSCSSFHTTLHPSSRYRSHPSECGRFVQ